MLKALFNHYRLIFRPEIFHKAGYKNFFFEGWFYKLVTARGDRVIAVIPAIYNGDENRAFIQILDGTGHKSVVSFWSADKFSSAQSEFSIKIGDNSFSGSHVSLNMDGDIPLEGELIITNPVLLKSSFLRPNIMGWYSYVPFMECNHALLAFSGRLNGILVINGEKVDFTGGKVYIEKDWGSSFPEGYIWCQSNHFDDSDTSFMFSVAKIPWLFSSFIGFLSAFNYDGKQYVFATYTGAKISKLEVTPSVVKVSVTQRKLRVDFEIQRAETGELIAPYVMNGLTKVTESLGSIITLKLTHNGKIIFEGTGLHAGLDINGIDISKFI
ncbi:MAG: hypothetical protein HUU43_16130 [Ignavibacteriaceae bacterium]|nr:hypothetical protein [Ignavibacteriaceae bacterium]